MRNQIIADRGSVQNVREIPQSLKDLYKTVWEIKQKVIIDQASDRGAYICQSQSLNIHMGDPSVAKLTSMHFYAWEKGLKTGMYYLRTRPKADAIQFTVDQTALKISQAKDTKQPPSSPSKKALVGDKENATNDENLKKPANFSIAGLDEMAEPACANCSA